MDQAPRPSGRNLTTRAFVNATLHGLGLVFAVTVIRPGSIGTPVSERLAHLEEAGALWTLAWCAWIGAAVAMVWFTAGVAGRLRTPGAWVALGVSLGAGVLDVCCDLLWIGSRAAPYLLSGFAAQQETAFLGGAGVANALYTLGVLLLVRALGQPWRASVTWIGAVVVGVGFLFSAVSISGPIELIYATSGLTLVAYAAWVVVVARHLNTHSRRSVP